MDIIKDLQEYKKKLTLLQRLLIAQAEEREAEHLLQIVNEASRCGMHLAASLKLAPTPLP